VGVSLRLMKDTQNLRVKFREFNGHDETAGMKDEIKALRKQFDMATEAFAHAALDAVAFMGFADYLADGKSDTRAGRQRSACIGGCLPRHEPAHGRRLPFAAAGVGALIVGVLFQTRLGQRLKRCSNRTLNRGSATGG